MTFWLQPDTRAYEYYASEVTSKSQTTLSDLDGVTSTIQPIVAIIIKGDLRPCLFTPNLLRFFTTHYLVALVDLETMAIPGNRRSSTSLLKTSCPGLARNHHHFL